MSGVVVSKMTPQGLFWVRLGGRSSEAILSVISHSIKYVDLVLIIFDLVLIIIVWF